MSKQYRFGTYLSVRYGEILLSCLSVLKVIFPQTAMLRSKVGQCDQCALVEGRPMTGAR